jgi:membrane-associated phospholipid phosphatase
VGKLSIFGVLYRRVPSLHDINLLVSAVAGIGIILPLFVVLEAGLAALGRFDLAWRWGAGFVLCFGGTYLLKFLDTVFSLRPIFPSGHVSMAVYTFGGLAFLLLGRGATREKFGWVIVATVGLVVGISRVILTEHNWFDVIGGIALGIACLPVVGCPRNWAALTVRARIVLGLIFVIATVPVLMFGPQLDSVLHRHVTY